jgi:class 3 adenylate cyclase
MQTPTGTVFVRRFPLRFASEIEIDFDAYYCATSLSQMRFAFALALLLIACFGGLDALLFTGTVRRNVWLIRYTVCCPAVALGLLSTFRLSFLPHIEKALALSSLAVGLGISFMTTVTPDAERPLYYAGVAQVLIYVYAFTRLRFVPAAVVCWAISLCYAALAMSFEHISPPILLNNILTLISFNIIGMSACYMLERGVRIDYFQQRLLSEKNEEIRKQQQLAESLLLNALPVQIAEELKQKGFVEPRYHDSVTILFTDFRNFTSSAERLSAGDLVSKLNEYFTAFDMICEKYSLERLKTIGDSYMCVGGVSSPSPSHAVDAVLAAFEMIEAVKARIDSSGLEWPVRVGLHTGPVISGIIGIRRFAFDIWGESVNFASRIETSGFPNRVNVSATSFARVKDFFECEHRGKIPIKDGREYDMYFAVSSRPSLLDTVKDGVPEAFARQYRSYFRRELRAFPSSLLPSALLNS